MPAARSVEDEIVSSELAAVREEILLHELATTLDAMPAADQCAQRGGLELATQRSSSRTLTSKQCPRVTGEAVMSQDSFRRCDSQMSSIQDRLKRQSRS